MIDVYALEVPKIMPFSPQRPSRTSQWKVALGVAFASDTVIDVRPADDSAVALPVTAVYIPWPVRLPLQSSPAFVGDSMSTSTEPVASSVCVRTQADVAIARLAAS